jgi:membrane protease YdiL (CAAX protease family)
MTVLVEGGMFGLAVLLSRWLGLVWDAPSWWSIGVGTVVALPSVALIPWSLRTTWEPAARLRRVVVEDVAPDLMRCGPPLLVLFSVCAGVSEEALFRGVLQLWLTSHVGAMPAVVMAALAFGVMHPASRDYVVAAALMGAWWGLSYHLSGSLMVPVVAHTLHDVAAMFALRHHMNGRGVS